MTTRAKLSMIHLVGYAALMAMAVPALAETPLHRPVEVHFERVSVEQVLTTLGEKVGVRFEYDADLMTDLTSVTYKAEDQEAGRVAMRILYPRGLELGEMQADRVPVRKRDPREEFKPKREENYEFARKPALTRKGDDVTISFETVGWCDVTVAIEDDRGTIIRHLASGVLGPNAPEPFVWNSKAQTLVWDGKNDKGEYVDDKDTVTVRVSLGLKPRFERTLYWSPTKRTGPIHAIAAGPDGVYVFDSGRGFDHVRRFDRDGSYATTVYPFPADRIDSIPDLHRHRWPDGAELPVKPNWLQSTLLLSGDNALRPTWNPDEGRYFGKDQGAMTGAGGNDLAVAGSRLALAGLRLSRISTDEKNDDLPLHGPDTTRWLEEDKTIEFRTASARSSHTSVSPRRMAFSPDGKWLYMTRRMEYLISYIVSGHWDSHTVQRMAFAEDEQPEVFLGTEEPGSDNGQFNKPADVDTDRHGRIYVADHGNHRVQVFSQDGEWLRNIDVKYPSGVAVHQQTDEIYVFCWPLPRHGRMNGYTIHSESGGRYSAGHLPPHNDLRQSYTRLHKFAPLDEQAEPIGAWNLPTRAESGRGRRGGFARYYATIDSWAEPTTIWLTPSNSANRRAREPDNIIVLREEGESLEVVRDFHKDTERSVGRTWTPVYHRQRLYVNPADGLLYVGEMLPGAGGAISSKAIQQVLRIDPATGRIRPVELPFDTEALAFDLDGHAYLRSSDQIVRYCSRTWREVPFDYGEERRNVVFGGGSLSRSAEVISGAVFPGNQGWHQGGMYVSAKGHIVVAVLYKHDPRSRQDEGDIHEVEGFLPPLYPGRHWGGMRGSILIYILDRHGNVVDEDALPGLGSVVNGVALDSDGDLYVLNTPTRVFDGQPHFNPMAGTLMKVTPGKARLLSSGRTPVPLGERPERSPDLRYGRFWVENHQWMYGGVGWGGGNIEAGCSCHSARFALDYFARSFTPEIDRYNVGVLDSAGNLILRVGQYGNVDDGKPLVEGGGPQEPRSIGGDEVALFHPAYVGTHTDHRLFIADAGNARIVSVKLGYHVNETVALKDVPDKE